jgi:hypothetical protein
MKRLLRRPSPALVIACIALFVSLGPAAYATHRGFLALAHPNSSPAQTSLSGSIAGAKVLQLTNTSTQAGAEGLGITVGANKAPIHVNSTAGKATFLNADKLDGLDSTGFMQGKGKFHSGRVTAADADVPLLAIAGFGTLYLRCFPPKPSVGSLGALGWKFQNTSGSDLLLFWDSVQTGLGDWTVATSPITTYIFSQHDFSSGDQRDRLILHIGRQTGATHRLATVVSTASFYASSNSCVAGAQAVAQVN